MPAGWTKYRIHRNKSLLNFFFIHSASTTLQCRDTHKADHMRSLFAKLYLSSIVVMLAAIVGVAVAAPGPEALYDPDDDGHLWHHAGHITK